MKKPLKRRFQDTISALTAKETIPYWIMMCGGILLFITGFLIHEYIIVATFFYSAGVALITVAMKEIYMVMVSRENVADIKNAIKQGNESVIDTIKQGNESVIDTIKQGNESVIDTIKQDGNETRKKLDTLSDKLNALVTILDKRLPKSQ